MKGDKAEYYISFERAFMFPRPKRVRKALTEIKRFVTKHTRIKEILVSNEVNEFIHKNSKNIARGVGAVLYKDEGKIVVFLQKGTGLDAYIKKRAEQKKKESKKKDDKGAAKAEAKDAKAEAKGSKETKSEDKEEDDEQKRLLEEKRIKEEAGKAIEMKRK